MIKPHYRSLIPGAGWLAVFLDDSEPYYSLTHIIGFAIQADDDGYEQVTAFVASGEMIDSIGDADGFFVFVHEAEVTDVLRAYWRTEGKKKIGESTRYG